MNQDPGQGQNQNPLMRVLVSSATALTMSVLLIGLYWFIPQHEPRLRPDGPARPAVRDGLWEQNDFLGLIDTQWSMRDGRAEGVALQYHPNGSLFREMIYRDGKLDGPLREYYEKGPYRRPPVRDRIATTQERRAASGVLKEEALYRNGVKEGSVTFDKDGRLLQKKIAKEDAWAPSR